MSLSKQDVEYVAALARLHVSEDEKESLSHELSRILEHASELQKLDLDGVEPTSHVGVTQTVIRKDEPHESMPPELVLMNAPDAEDDQFKVPAVLEG
jgi:aspartyl-tRNA(Asn)/glutamyl-tRNA(Gln) amidotransferase subunit C